MVLLFGARAATDDVDAYFVQPAAAIMRAHFCSRRALPAADWLNDGAKGYLVGHATRSRRRLCVSSPAIMPTKRGTRFRTFGTRAVMIIRDLVEAILSGDLLAARQWVADALRANVVWSDLERPSGLSERELVVAGGMVELLATRGGALPPRWTGDIGAEDQPLVLDPGLERMPRSFERARTAGPEPLRKRNLIALPDFLDVA
jgi:hypothetical protein